VYALWRAEPQHPGLRFKCVNKREEVYSIRVGLNWRALAYKDGDSLVWFWIGSHAEYDRLVATL
jgi:hypothetical protein